MNVASLAALTHAALALRGELDDLVRQLRAQGIRIDRAASSGGGGGLIAGGGAANLAQMLEQQEDHALVKLDAYRANGEWDAYRMSFNDAGTLTFDTDYYSGGQPAVETVFCSAGGFNGAICFARYCGYHGTTPRWLAYGLDVDGFNVKLLGSAIEEVDAGTSQAYESAAMRLVKFDWYAIPDDRPVWMPQHSRSSTGLYAYDSARTHYPKTLMSARVAYPTHVPVHLRATMLDRAPAFFFTMGSEPQSET